ncbi:MAG: GIDE domain-containing protein [Terriglobales bacterium]
MNPILQLIAANHLTLAAGGAAGVGMCFFFCGVQLLARTNSSHHVSKISIGAATPGLAAIAGKTTGARTLTAPISGRPCYAYQTSILQRESTGKKEWKNVAEETGHVTFLIQDETGELLVEPSGAELDLGQNFGEEYGSPSLPSETSNQISNNEIVPAVSSFLARNGISLDRPTRVEEYCLEPETSVVITGTVTRNSGVPADSLASTFASSSRNAQPAIAKAAANLPPQQPEIVRLASGSAVQSTTQMSQQAKIAAALAKAGIATADLWATSEDGVQAINLLIDGHSRPTQSSSDSNATAMPALALTGTMTMTKGSDDPTFIISNRNQASKPTSIGWKSVALVLAGSTITTLSVYLLLVAHLH